MNAKMKDVVIFCPECGAPGLFTYPNCKHKVRFSIQWERERGEDSPQVNKEKEPEDKSKELKKKKPGKKPLNFIESKTLEEPTEDVPENFTEDTKNEEIKESDTPKGDALEEREKEIEDREPEIKEEGERQDKEDEKKIKKLEIKIPMAEVKNTRNNTPDVFDLWEFWKKFNE
jgi:hypothetical protein